MICIPEIGEGRMPGKGAAFGVDGVVGALDWERTMFLLRNDIFREFGDFGWTFWSS